MTRKSAWLAICLTLCVEVNTSLGQLFFRGLGGLPGGGQSSGAHAVSPDGSVAVGGGGRPDGTAEPMLWTETDGMRSLGYLPGGNSYGSAYDVSENGGVVVGTTKSSNSAFEAFRWTSTGGMSSLGSLTGAPPGSYTDALGISADGAVVVGGGHSSFGQEAFRWTSADGMVGLGDLAGGGFLSVAYGISSDGSVIVGRGLSASGEEAMRWTQSMGMVGIGDLAGGNFRSEARATSSDGAVIVGWGNSPQSGDLSEAYRWSASTGMVGLGDLPGGDYFSYSEDVSGNGSVVVGVAVDGTDQYYDAFIWDATNGMRKLEDVLQDEFGLDLTGWHLSTADGISNDGLTIVGTGFNPDGRTEAWMVHLPEPTTIAMMIAALAILPIPRRQHALNRAINFPLILG
jgi:probable HAF family extracellular repeat protein